MAERDVTEFDLRAEEFKRRDIKPEDYEFRSDGKIVRKDRWINAIHRIQGIVGPAGHEFEIDDVVGLGFVSISDADDLPLRHVDPASRDADTARRFAPR